MFSMLSPKHRGSMIKGAALRASLSALKHHFTRGLSKTFDKKTIQQLKRQNARTGGPESFLLFGASKALGAAAGKRGKAKIRNAVWKATQKAPLDVDTALGNVAVDATKKTPLKNLFKVKEQVPAGKDLIREVERPSITAPLAKARDIATPLIVGYTVEKGLRKMREKKSE